MRFSATKFALPILAFLPAWALAQDTQTVANSQGSVIDLTPVPSAVLPAVEAVDTVREGTHLVNRTGRLSRSKDNQQWIISFDNDGTETIAPRMVVQPNLNLYSMESILSGRNSPVTFRVSGTVTEYKNRNYILIDNAQTTLVQPSTQPVKQITTKAHTASPVAGAQLPNDPQTTAPSVATAQSIMNRLLAPLPQEGQPMQVPAGLASASDISTGKASVAPDAPVLKVIREGTHLTERTARLNHSPDGKQAFLTFDTDGKALQDPPMIILPNLKVQTMEGTVTGLARDVHFRVSGTITEYKGRNYILLEKASAIPDVENVF